MMGISKWTMQREECLKKIIQEKEKALENNPEGTLRANKHGNSFQYYVRTKGARPNGRYLKSSEKKLAIELAQKEYDLRVMVAAKNEMAVLEKLNKIYQAANTAEEQFMKMPGAKQDMIRPIELSDAQYIAKWRELPYKGLEFQNQTLTFFSDNNEQMRSKSEVIIANMLRKYDVPYKYECPVMLDGRLVYPDFNILNVRKRKELYWEHLGLLDDPEYLEKNLNKLNRYAMNGYFPGDRLILTYETAGSPLNMRIIELLIRKYCL